MAEEAGLKPLKIETLVYLRARHCRACPRPMLFGVAGTDGESPCSDFQALGRVVYHILDHCHPEVTPTDVCRILGPAFESAGLKIDKDTFTNFLNGKNSPRGAHTRKEWLARSRLVLRLLLTGKASDYRSSEDTNSAENEEAVSIIRFLTDGGPDGPDWFLNQSLRSWAMPATNAEIRAELQAMAYFAQRPAGRGRCVVVRVSGGDDFPVFQETDKFYGERTADDF